ncbi:TraX family protein [[Mycoplasma] mobile]|uniref:TraX protein n=1 Tax=Mycoplasma mobile (strain ATCC 43663 / 163K / NCTC 11711) TaxID=267748 RepID=Q6KI12_MYCM1|nr:TraX family protein [[Mycoplasma] mobile]AAT27764.1 conserved hypothetical protein [Mycoplasma mobile 163K]
MKKCIQNPKKWMWNKNFIDNNISIKFLGGIALKIIAVVFMFVDHFGLIVFPQNDILRILGRISMPLFAFLIAIGMNYTSNRKKYLFRLLIYFIILQIPITIFLLISNTNLGKGYVNIFFNLSTGAGFIYIYKYKKIWSIPYLILISIFLILNDVPEFSSPIDVDYGWYGFYLIIGFFFSFEFTKNLKTKYSFLISKLFAIIILISLTLIWVNVSYLWLSLSNSSIPILSTISKRGIYDFSNKFQIYALFAIPFILFFKAKKEKSTSIVKYSFYLAYPLSFFIPTLISMIISIV